jgi:hypothetical protein
VGLVFAEGEQLTNCCGLWIEWDEESKTGTILTTAHLIRSKHPTENHWKGSDEYNVKANVSFFSTFTCLFSVTSQI